MKLDTFNAPDKPLLVLLVCTRIADIVTTYIVTPDLMKEKNSINTMLLKRSWFLIITFQILLIGSIIVFFMYFKKKAQFIPVDKKGVSMHFLVCSFSVMNIPFISFCCIFRHGINRFITILRRILS